MTITLVAIGDELKRRHSYADDLSKELDGSIEMPVTTAPPLAGGALLGLAVVLTALNLRPAVTSVAPVLGEMRTDLGVTATWAGVLTTLPGLCFAAAGLAAPWLAARIGLGRAVSVSLLIICTGLAIRGVGGAGIVLGASLVACAGIALINVLIPVVIKGSFPTRVGLMTGIYTAALSGGGALGSALTPGLEEPLGGWRPALAVWAVLAIVALAVWMPAARRHGTTWALPVTPHEPRRSLLRSKLAWIVTLFFGTQAFLAYIVMGWLPEVFIDSGMPKLHAGLLVGLSALIGVPVALIVAPIAARSPGQSGWIVVLGLFGVAGTVGVMIAPNAQPVLWCVLIGVGQSVFALALAVIALRARTAAQTAQLSGMAQGFGYLLAGTGPLLFGVLHDVTGGWTIPWTMFLAVYAVQIVAGVLAGRHRFV